MSRLCSSWTIFTIVHATNAERRKRTWATLRRKMEEEVLRGQGEVQAWLQASTQNGEGKPSQLRTATGRGNSSQHLQTRPEPLGVVRVDSACAPSAKSGFRSPLGISNTTSTIISTLEQQWKDRTYTNTPLGLAFYRRRPLESGQCCA